MDGRIKTSLAILATVIVASGCSSGASDAGNPAPQNTGPTNQAPIANAGADIVVDVNSGPVALDGFASSDPEGRPITFQWTASTTQGRGSVTLKGEKTATPTFDPATPGSYEFVLSVSDGETTATDTVVAKVNGPPAANAGTDARVNVGTQQVALDAATSSDPNDDSLSFSWEIVAPVDHGNSVLTAPNQSATALVLDPAISGPYTLRVTTGDGRMTATDDVRVELNTPPGVTAMRVIDDNDNPLPPLVHQLPGSFNPVKLEALATDADGDPGLSFAWSILATPDGSNVSLAAADTARPTFTPVALGKYLLHVDVGDGTGTGSAEFEVEVFNTAPVADAGSDTKVSTGAGVSVSLSGAKSVDPDGDNLTYSWRVMSAPPGSIVGTTFGVPKIVAPAFTPDRFGFYEFELTVSDGVEQRVANVQVGVINPNFQVAADADRNTATLEKSVDVSKGETVSLTAAMQTDVTGQTLEFQWKQVTANGAVVDPAKNVINFTFNAPKEVTTLMFRIEVTSDAGNVDVDEVQINVLEDATKAVFVSALKGGDGVDVKRGTRELPYKSLQAAIDRAAQIGGADVYATGGTYAESITLKDAVSVYGGYDDGGANAPTWIRDIVLHKSLIKGGTSAVEGSAVSNLTLDGFTIESADATAAGASSYGLKLHDHSSVTVSRNTIHAGRGANGGNGAPAPGVTSAGHGGNGHSACFPYEFNPLVKGTCNRVSDEILLKIFGSGKLNQPRCEKLPTVGGAGGLNFNGGTGGRGGRGGFDTIAPEDGLPAVNGGKGGSALSGKSGNGGPGDPVQALSGAAGSPGREVGEMSVSEYVTASGADGADGDSNQGGGGGGGGGVQGVINFVSETSKFICNIAGGYGGGGGGAAVGGVHGSGGGGGGGSFGVYLASATGATLVDNTITTSAGGNGGQGSDGGIGGISPGGQGGLGLSGGSFRILDPLLGASIVEWSTIGAGGNGGNARGGNGGHGGGGGGGPTIGIAVIGADSAAVSTLQSKNSVTPGTAGTGGASPGSRGSDGVSQAVFSF